MDLYKSLFSHLSIKKLLWAIPSETTVFVLIKFNSMIPAIKSLKYFCEIATGENRVGSKRRERDKEIKGLTDWEMECWTEMGMAGVGNGH